MSAELRRCVTLFTQVLNILQVRYNCAKFHHFRICAIDFRERGEDLFSPPAFVSSPKNTLIQGKGIAATLQQHYFNLMSLLAVAKLEQQQGPVVFYRESCFQKFSNIHRKSLVLALFSKDLRAATFLKGNCDIGVFL